MRKSQKGKKDEDEEEEETGALNQTKQSETNGNATVSKRKYGL